MLLHFYKILHQNIGI